MLSYLCCSLEKKVKTIRAAFVTDFKFTVLGFEVSISISWMFLNISKSFNIIKEDTKSSSSRSAGYSQFIQNGKGQLICN